MSYKPPKKNYLLEFESRPGLHIRTKGASLEELDRVSGMNANLMHKDRGKRLELFTFFAEKIIEWDMEHPEPDSLSDGVCAQCGLAEDAPMPPTFESLLCLDIDLAVEITIGWATTISRVSVPKGLSSPAGGNSGPSIPLSDGMTDEIMRKLEHIQSPMRLPEPNFT